MRITFLGHAGMRVETRDVTLLCDPWFSARGAFVGSWHPLPDNRHVAHTAEQASHVYVSHDHRDHFDADVLNRLPPDVRLIVPNFPVPSWHELVASVRGRPVGLLDDNEVMEIGESTRVRLVTSPTPRHHDSALVIEDTDTGQVVVNLNDCQLDRDQLAAIRGRYPRIDVVAAQFSGATWFPFVYSFPHRQQVAAARRKRISSMRRWYNYMATLQPRFAVAFAGPPILLDPSLRGFFDGPASIFTTPGQLRTWLGNAYPDVAARLVAPLPGDVLDLDRERFTPDPVIRRDFDWRSVDDHVAPYARRRAAAIARELSTYRTPTGDLFPAFAAHFERLFEAGEETCRTVDSVVAFEILGGGGGNWVVDLQRLRVRRVTDLSTVDHEHRFTLESRFLPPILRGDMTWDEFFLSFRFRAWRTTVDAYNEELMSLLRYSDPADLEAYTRQMRQARSRPASYFRLDTEQGSYLVPDRCPHNGMRLTAEDYHRGGRVMVCPQHGWRFAIPGGACLNGRARLNVRPADA